MNRKSSSLQSPWPHHVTKGEGFFSQNGDESEEEEEMGGGRNKQKIKGHCGLFKFREKCLACVWEEAPQRGGSGLKGSSPGMTPTPAPQDLVGVEEGPR